MSVFRQVFASKPVPEATTESSAIEVELKKIDELDVFLHSFADQLSRKRQMEATAADLDMTVWNNLKNGAMDWKKEDYQLGTFLSKAAQANLVMQTISTKSIDNVSGVLMNPLLKWSREDVKSAKEQSKNYKSLHQTYTDAVHEVKKINSKQSVPLNVLQKAEHERDQLKFSFESEGKRTLQSLQHIYQKGRLDTVKQICLYLQSEYEYYKTSLSVIERLQEDIRGTLDYIGEKETGQKMQTKQLQENIKTLAEQEKAASAKKQSATAVDQQTPVVTSGEAVALTTKNLQTVFEYEVKRDKSRFKLRIDIPARAITVTAGNDVTTASVDDVIHIIKANKNSEGTKIKIMWKTQSDKFDVYVFNSHQERDQFYEAFWFSKKGQFRWVQSGKKPPTTEAVRMWMGTWNMGDAAPTYDGDLNAWMPKNQFDFYIAALQESEFTPRSGYGSPEDDLFAWFGHHLGENYIKLAGVSLLSIRLVCFVRRDHYFKITGVKTSTVATGLANVIGNKGGAGISFNFYDTRMCFVGTHLAARIDRKRLEVRNQNYRDIIKGLSQHSVNGLADVHHEFDYLFWMGDLNYRIELPRDEILDRIGRSEWAILRKADQLINERAAQNCFIDFEETEPNFQPTYRYNRGDRTFSAEKMREPAWCDRVLWKAIPRGTVKQLHYGPCHSLMTSDHSPVFATFCVHTDLPAAPHVRTDKCKIVFTDLRGFDLKPMKGNFADPYILFQAHWNASYAQTSTCEKTTNPTWEGQEYVLFPSVTNRDFLNKAWIRLVVRDNASRNADMGAAIVYLEQALNKPTKFTARVVDKARVYGHIQGTVHVQFDPSYTDPFEMDPASRANLVFSAPIVESSNPGAAVGAPEDMPFDDFGDFAPPEEALPMPPGGGSPTGPKSSRAIPLSSWAKTGSRGTSTSMATSPGASSVLSQPQTFAAMRRGADAAQVPRSGTNSKPEMTTVIAVGSPVVQLHQQTPSPQPTPPQPPSPTTTPQIVTFSPGAQPTPIQPTPAPAAPAANPGVGLQAVAIPPELAAALQAAAADGKLTNVNMAGLEALLAMSSGGQHPPPGQ